MITFEELKAMKPGTVFAQGTLRDEADGLNVTGSGAELKWVACRGDIPDWAIYCHHSWHDWDYIKALGDKIHDTVNIKQCVEVDDEMLKHYRH